MLVIIGVSRLTGEVKRIFVKIFKKPIRLFSRKQIEQYKDKIDHYRYERLLEVLSLHSTKGVEDISENYFINNIISFRNKRAQDIMIPRIDIVTIEDESNLDDLLKVMSKSGFSRIPVFKDTLDSVIGFVHIKDLIPFIKKRAEINLPNIVRNVLFISPYMNLFDLLYEMKLKRAHMAMVVDEFGGVDGLITFEDLLEEIVGDIRDEYDVAPIASINTKEPGIIEVDGRVDIDDLEKQTGIFSSFEEKEESNTISGLIVSLVGYIPAKNEIISHPSGVEFTILSVDPLKINKVLVDFRKLMKKNYD